MKTPCPQKRCLYCASTGCYRLTSQKVWLLYVWSEAIATVQLSNDTNPSNCTTRPYLHLFIRPSEKF